MKIAASVLNLITEAVRGPFTVVFWSLYADKWVESSKHTKLEKASDRARQIYIEQKGKRAFIRTKDGSLLDRYGKDTGVKFSDNKEPQED